METVLGWVTQYGSISLFFLMMLGIIGLPVPDETLLVFSGYLIFKGTLHPVFTFSMAFLGSVTGITVSYYLGRVYGLKLIHKYGRYFHLTEERYQKVHNWFEKIGRWSLFFGYYIAGVRHFTAMVAGASGREPSAITLIAVTKVFPASAIREAYELGVRDFGENYLQEFEGKLPQVQDLTGARFHLIGHLQSNKAKRAAELFHAIQTVDSEKLARRLDEAGKALDVMLEVKLSPEEAKHGVDPAGLPALIEAVGRCANLRLNGLMTMPPWSEGGGR